MLRFGSRSVLAVTAAAIGAAALLGCQPQAEGLVRVAVIGSEPQMADPRAGGLTPGEAILLGNVAQGLIQFDARGQIEPGLAERWNVSDDGLSYIFRLASGEWPDGSKITAQQVARILRRQVDRASDNQLKDSLAAVEDIVAMTDRVIEIRLTAPRPDLLQLLAQPEFAIVRNGQGTGPFEVAESPRGDAGVRLQRRVEGLDGEEDRREQLAVSGADAPAAIGGFVDGTYDLVLGGDFTTLPLAQRAQVGRSALQFDPAAGLFGLVPARTAGPAANPEVRRLLSQAIDRDALIAALAVPGLIGRATILESGLDGLPDPAAPAWLEVPIGDRRPGLMAISDRLTDGEERPVIRVALPDGPGADVLHRRLAEDWGLLGFAVERVAHGQPADFRLIDRVAPSTSAAWYLHHFECGVRPVCSAEADSLLRAARAAPVPPQRNALLAQAAALMDQDQLFIPLAAPIRWALVSNRIQGFARNRFAWHALTGLEQQLDRPIPE